jgi:outer membrane protein TolC
VPGLPATGLPAELLERRPDVRSAFLRLEASDSDVAAAVKDQYPRIDLAAAVSTTADSPSGLFSSWLGTIAGQITAPLFDGDRRKSEIERTVAVRRQRLAEYGQVVLFAFREVEDALALETYQVQRIRSLADQLALAVSTYRQLGSQYLNGAADFIDVLIALRQQQELERSLLTAQLDRVRFRIALYRALAGSFATPREVVAEAAAGDEDAAHD